MFYKSIPFSFSGNKLRACDVVSRNVGLLGGVRGIVDVFGGSGILSANLKKDYPHLPIVYNDFDGYSRQLVHLEELEDAYCYFNDKLERLGFLNRSAKNYVGDVGDVGGVIECFKKNERGYCDFVLGCVLKKVCHSGVCVAYKTESMYRDYFLKYARVGRKMFFLNRIPKFKAVYFDRYLDGLDVRHADWRELLREFLGRNYLFLCDPPYIQTEQGAYSGDFHLKDVLDLIGALKHENVFYFCNNESGFFDVLKSVTAHFAGKCVELLNIRIVKKSIRKDQNDSCLTKKAEQIYYYGAKDLGLFSAELASVGGG